MKKLLLSLLASLIMLAIQGQIMGSLGAAAGITHEKTFMSSVQLNFHVDNTVFSTGYIHEEPYLKIGLHYPLGETPQCDDRRWFITPTFGIGWFKTIENKEKLVVPMGMGGVELSKKIQNQIALFTSVNYQNRLVIGLVGIKYYTR